MTDIVERLRKRMIKREWDDDPLVKVLGDAADEIERLRAALVESVLANERAFHDLAMYAAVDTVNPPAWFRSKFDGLSEAIRAARAALEPKE